MEVKENSVVQFHYTLSAAEGDFSESSREGDAVACLVGHNNVLPAIEQALVGMEPGQTKSISLQPEEGYGVRREGAVQRVPIKHLLTKGKLRPGMVVKVNTQDGTRDATVLKVGKFNVDLDTNHPLAGQILEFEISVDEVREATAEEIAHGHAHGPGGHHHH